MNTLHGRVSFLAGVLLALALASPQAFGGTFNTPGLVPEVANKAAKAAMEACRDRDYQVAAAVVDRGGNTQALIRDRFAGAHTIETAINKGWTAVSFRRDTLELLDIASTPGEHAFGIHHLPRVVVLGGGIPIEADGRIVAGIGVSGSPDGDTDHECAAEGIEAIEEDLF